MLFSEKQSLRLQRSIGRTVEMMYIDRQGKITHRLVQIKSVKEHHVLGYCLMQREQRIFKIENILAMEPAKKRFI